MSSRQPNVYGRSSAIANIQSKKTKVPNEWVKQQPMKRRKLRQSKLDFSHTKPIRVTIELDIGQLNRMAGTPQDQQRSRSPTSMQSRSAAPVIPFNLKDEHRISEVKNAEVFEDLLPVKNLKSKWHKYKQQKELFRNSNTNRSRFAPPEDSGKSRVINPNALSPSWAQIDIKDIGDYPNSKSRRERLYDSSMVNKQLFTKVKQETPRSTMIKRETPRRPTKIKYETPKYLKRMTPAKNSGFKLKGGENKPKKRKREKYNKSPGSKSFAKPNNSYNRLPSKLKPKNSKRSRLTPSRLKTKLTKRNLWTRKRKAMTGDPEWLRWDHPPPELQFMVPSRSKPNTIVSGRKLNTCKVSHAWNRMIWSLEAWTTGVNIRETARKRLIGALAQLGTDLKVNFVRIAIELESALFETFSGNGKHYTEQLREIMFNLGSKKNLDFRTRILKEEIEPRSVARMKASDMASCELIKVREKIHRLAVAEKNSEHLRSKFLGKSQLKAIWGDDVATTKID